MTSVTVFDKYDTTHIFRAADISYIGVPSHSVTKNPSNSAPVDIVVRLHGGNEIVVRCNNDNVASIVTRLEGAMTSKRDPK